jgi:hypothetical protein
MGGHTRLEVGRALFLAALTAAAGSLLGAGGSCGTLARAGVAARPSALAARTISLEESGRLHLASKHGFTLNEEGSASGTVGGAIYIHLTVASIDRVTAEVSIYPSDGSISGYATASYHVAGATASFSGTMSVARGTGSYDHAHASGLGFSGTIARSNDAVTVRLSGRMAI